MSLIFRTYGCGSDECGREWEVLVERTDPPPAFCPWCGAPFEGEPIPGTHSTVSNITKVGDRVYRMVEETSAANAAVNDAPWMKVTNMKDRLREGDVAAMPVRNTVTQFMEASNRGEPGPWSQNGAMPRAAYGFQGGMAAMTGEVRPTADSHGAYRHAGPGHIALEAIQGDLGKNHTTSRAMRTAIGQVKEGKN